MKQTRFWKNRCQRSYASTITKQRSISARSGIPLLRTGGTSGLEGGNSCMRENPNYGHYFNTCVRKHLPSLKFLLQDFAVIVPQNRMIFAFHGTKLIWLFFCVCQNMESS